MNTRTIRKESRERRSIDLFGFGEIEYESGDNTISGSFELTGLASIGKALAARSEDRESGAQDDGNPDRSPAGDGIACESERRHDRRW